MDIIGERYTCKKVFKSKKMEKGYRVRNVGWKNEKNKQKISKKKRFNEGKSEKELKRDR